MREEPMMAAPGPAPAPAGGSASSSGNAGPLGGVSSTVGSVAGAAGSATGTVAGTAGSTLGATTDATLGSSLGAVVATPARAIRLDSQAQARNQTRASSVLSTRDGHLHLDSGTQLEFRVAGQAEKQAKPD